MTMRVLMLVALIFTYLSVRLVVYHYFVPLGMGKNYEPDGLDKFFSYAISVPLTVFFIFTVVIVWSFVVYGGL